MCMSYMFWCIAVKSYDYLCTLSILSVSVWSEKMPPKDIQVSGLHFAGLRYGGAAGEQVHATSDTKTFTLVDYSWSLLSQDSDSDRLLNHKLLNRNHAKDGYQPQPSV